MRYFEVSQKIGLSKDVTEQALKQALLDRLQRAFTIGSFVEDERGFDLEIKTGVHDSPIKNSKAQVHVELIKTKDAARFLVYGQSGTSMSLTLWYSFLFLIVLLLGLVPGSIETGAENSGAMDVLVFIVFGIFTFYDIDKKLDEPKCAVTAALASLETEFGTL